MFFYWFLFCYIVADNDRIVCLHLQYSTQFLSPPPVATNVSRGEILVFETRKMCVNGRS